MLLLTADPAASVSLPVRITLLLLFAGALYLVLRVLRPRLREHRHEQWRRAGLLPPEDPDDPAGPDDPRGPRRD